MELRELCLMFQCGHMMRISRDGRHVRLAPDHGRLGNLQDGATAWAHAAEDVSGEVPAGQAESRGETARRDINVIRSGPLAVAAAWARSVCEWSRGRAARAGEPVGDRGEDDDVDPERDELHMGPVAPPAVAEERQGVLDEPYVILGASSRMGLPLTQATQPPREKNARRVTSTWTALRTSLGDRRGGRCRRTAAVSPRRPAQAHVRPRKTADAGRGLPRPAQVGVIGSVRGGT